MEQTLKATLRKLSSSGDQLSRDVYTGAVVELPALGHKFIMATNEAGFVVTTEVVAYNTNYETGDITFRTRNSEYLLTLEK